MKKEIYLYSNIYDFVAESLISQMEENKTSEITMRVNTQGGDVLAGWGIIGKMNEMPGGIVLKVDGSAMSMGALLLPYANRVECLDVTQIMLHRASMYCSTPEDESFLANVNKNLRAKLESKIDDDKLFQLKGIRIENLFEDEKRFDLHLTAKEAKAIGLVDKINTLTPFEINAIADKAKSINAKFKVAAEYKPEAENNPQNPKKMTVAEFKAAHPAAYNEIHGLGVVAGVAQEKERVEACLVFIDVDPVTVKALIESGKPMGMKAMAELALKSASPKKITAIKNDSTGAVDTEEPEAEKTAKEKEVADFEVEARKSLGLK